MCEVNEIVNFKVGASFVYSFVVLLNDDIVTPFQGKRKERRLK